MGMTSFHYSHLDATEGSIRRAEMVENQRRVVQYFKDRKVTLNDKLSDQDLMFYIGRAIGNLPSTPSFSSSPLTFTGPHGYNHSPIVAADAGADYRGRRYPNLPEYAATTIKHFREHILYHETLDKMVKARIAEDKAEAANPLKPTAEELANSAPRKPGDGPRF